MIDAAAKPWNAGASRVDSASPARASDDLKHVGKSSQVGHGSSKRDVDSKNRDFLRNEIDGLCGRFLFIRSDKGKNARLVRAFGQPMVATMSEVAVVGN